MNEDGIVVDLVKLNSGELARRTRLQQTVYLLHRCGADFDLQCAFSRYGLCSAKLAYRARVAQALGEIEGEKRRMAPNPISGLQIQGRHSCSECFGKAVGLEGSSAA